jgi:hypothetical protein
MIFMDDEEREIHTKMVENQRLQNILRRRHECLDRRMRRDEHELFDASLLLNYRYCVVYFEVNSIKFGTIYYKVCSFDYDRLKIMIINREDSPPIVIDDCDWDEFYYNIYMVRECKPITKYEFDMECRKANNDYIDELLNF